MRKKIELTPGTISRVSIDDINVFFPIIYSSARIKNDLAQGRSNKPPESTFVRLKISLM